MLYGRDRLLLALTALGLCGFPLAASAKDTLTLGMAVEPSGLDPTIAAPTAIREVTWGNVFEGLVTIDEKGSIKPLLATSWTVSPDGLVYTFKLRPAVTFHNGTPFDSGIVKFSLDRARAADSTNAQKRFFEPIDHIDTPDNMTAVIALKQPSGLFVYHLGWGDAVMVDPKTVATNKTAPVGTGPFKFASWQRGNQVKLVRNDAYWDKGVPNLSAVTFRFIGDPQAQAAALRGVRRRCPLQDVRRRHATQARGRPQQPQESPRQREGSAGADERHRPQDRDRGRLFGVWHADR